MITVATFENSKLINKFDVDEFTDNAVDKALVKCDLAALELKENQTVGMFQNGKLVRFIDGKNKKWKFTKNSIYL